jgi:hypothetical protein
MFNFLSGTVSDAHCVRSNMFFEHMHFGCWLLSWGEGVRRGEGGVEEG